MILASSRPSRDVASRRRAFECLLLFGGAPLFLAWCVPPTWWPWLLASAGVLCVMFWLRRGPAVRRCWLRPLQYTERKLLPFLAWRLVICALLLAVPIALFAPERLFDLPREHTRLWLLLLVSYPLFSVLPQEVLYRYLFRLRYRRVFRPFISTRLFPAAWIMPSAIAFAWVHVAYANPLAPLLCLAGGWFFARTYHESRSLRLAVAEHTLYGALVFSVGLGGFFLHSGMGLI